MANGVLGRVMSVANSDVVVYTVPSTVDFATVSINLVNQTGSAATIRIAIAASATPGLADYIEYDAILAGKGDGLERTCMVLSAGESIIVRSSNANVAVRVYGLEKLI